MYPVCRVLVLLFLLHSGTAAAESQPAPPLDLAQRIAVTEQTWLEALGTRPMIVSLGTFPDLGNAEEELTSILRDRLKLLNKKVFSNRQWRKYWTEQARFASTLESLYGELAKTRTAAGDAATAKQLLAREWVVLAEAKVSNQDAFLAAVQMEFDSVDERLESALLSDARVDKETKQTAHAQGMSATPLETRTELIAQLRFQQTAQNERRAAAAVELKLLEQQAQSSLALRPAIQRDVELVRDELRIAKAQGLRPDPAWSERWLAVADHVAAKSNKLGEELALSVSRERLLEFEVSLAKSQVSYRAQKHSEIERERREAEAFSGWWKAALATVWQQAPRVTGLLLLILLAGGFGLWMVGLAARTLVKVADAGGPERISAAEQRVNTVAAALKGVGEIAVYFLVLLAVCDVVGLDTGPILGSLAILGLALSFGSQNLVRDFVNGFFILAEDQYSVGDWVKIGNYEGDVEQINIRSTRLRSITGVLQIIPNGTINAVENMTRDWSCFRCHVGVTYDSDIDLVERVCNEVGAEMLNDPELEGKLIEAPAFVGVTELGDSAVVVRCMAKTQPGAQWGLERKMYRRLKRAFAAAGIEIAFPQRVVWHRSESSGSRKPREASKRRA